MRKIIVTVAAVVVLVVGSVWWEFFHTKTFEARLLAEHRHAQLREILAIVQKNPRICIVSTEEVGIPTCGGSQPTERDLRDAARLRQVLAEIPANYVSTTGDGEGKLGFVTIEVFEQGLLAPPAEIEWTASHERRFGDYPRCVPLSMPGWAVCPGKLIFL